MNGFMDENIQKQLDCVDGKTEEELLAELLQAKQSGAQISDDDFDAFVLAVGSMLTQEQMQKLTQLRDLLV